MKIILAIGKGIEAEAADVAKFLETLAADARNIFTPRGLLALAMLATPVAEAVAVTGAAAAASNPRNHTRQKAGLSIVR